jgi:hypothetical protein
MRDVDQLARLLYALLHEVEEIRATGNESGRGVG